MIEFIWSPLPSVMAEDFFDFADEISSYEEPFGEAIADVMVGSISANFNSGGRPAWQPLAAYTVEKKGGSDILIDSGSLKSDATDPASWDVGSHEASLEGIDDYGFFQNTGFFNVQFLTDVPARPWALFQDQDADAIGEIFINWIERKAEETRTV